MKLYPKELTLLRVIDHEHISATSDSIAFAPSCTQAHIDRADAELPTLSGELFREEVFGINARNKLQHEWSKLGRRTNTARIAHLQELILLNGGTCNTYRTVQEAEAHLTERYRLSIRCTMGGGDFLSYVARTVEADWSNLDPDCLDELTYYNETDLICYKRAVCLRLRELARLPVLNDERDDLP